MRDIYKKKDELIKELVELRQKNAELKSMKPSEEPTKAENAPQLNEELFQAIVENQVQFVDRYLPGGILTYVNSALSRYVGVSPEDLIGKSFFPFLHKDDLQDLVRELEALTPEKPFVKTENRVILPDGSMHWHRWVHQAFFDEGGKVREYQSAGEDITDQKKAEESLRQSEKKFRTLAANFPDIIARFDRQLRHLYASPSVKRYTGLPAENFLGKTNAELGMFADNVNIWNERLRQVFETGEPEEFSFEFSSISHSYFFSSLLVPEFDETGAIESVMAIVRDITERKQGEEEKKRLEEQLHQSQKMESIGLLAGGVAHDFNNILSAIVGYGYMAQQQVKDDAATGGYIQEILDAAHRAADLTQGLLAFSRKQVIKPVLADLNDIVMNISRMLRRTIVEDIELNMELSAGKLSVMVDVGQIEQVLMNLATNARDAMPKGGRLGIKTDAVNVDSGCSEMHYLHNARMDAVLTVSDTGMGMDQGTQENIFEPFFTTKEVGKGTGLGLSIVYGIIKQHNGYIRVHSETGSGTTFEIYLPMAEEGRETIFEPKIETPPAGKGETIIVAEDEPQVRKSMRLILQGNGYKIIEAENGEDAVRKFQENRSAVSLILLDVIMPVKNGREAYEQIKGIESSVKAIFMSGYTDDIITKKGLLEEGFDLISKPINPDTLIRKIRDVLDR